MKKLMTFLCFVVVMTLVQGAAWAQESSSIEHVVVAIEKDRFHGWPANNGIWQWGEEILVGFTQGDYVFKRGHNIGGRQDSLLARSVDGGLSWKMFDPTGFLDDENEQFLGGGKTVLGQPIDFSHPDFALRIFGRGYHGNRDPEGGFFYSYDRGASWNGPYAVNGLTNHPEMTGKILSGRTDYIVQGRDRCLIFISAHDPSAEPQRERMACIETTDGGLTFDFVAWVSPETDNSRAIMSQTVQLSGRQFVQAFRKIYVGVDRDDTIEAYRSVDGCRSWEHLSTVKVMKTSSNPPALVRMQDGRLCCAYGDRNVGEIRARYSNDHGKTWGPELIIRDDFAAPPDDPDTQRGLNADIGYVRLVERPDGKLVAVYYWVTEEHSQQHIAASIWQP